MRRENFARNIYGLQVLFSPERRFPIICYVDYSSGDVVEACGLQWSAFMMACHTKPFTKYEASNIMNIVRGKRELSALLRSTWAKSIFFALVVLHLFEARHLLPHIRVCV